MTIKRTEDLHDDCDPDVTPVEWLIVALLVVLAAALIAGALIGGGL